LHTPSSIPWYQRTFRWGQTNLTQIDPTLCDIDFWRDQWRKTHIQGVILNAGGIVAYYPSEIPYHHRADHLNNRDLLGELISAAREEGLSVVARMDSNRCYEPLYQAHPDWIAVNQEGEPYRAGDLFITCIHSPYYSEFIPSILREIIHRYQPDGFTDNSWSGLHRDQVCYCDFCQASFYNACSLPLPQTVDWNDPIYHRWIRWSYARRLEVWDFFNRVTHETGGSNCLWAGMNSGSLLGQSRSLRDMKAISERSEIIFLDHQTRDEEAGFQGNSHIGKLIHGIVGWDHLISESMAMYQSPRPTFRITSRPEAEARLWMVEGFAGGIQPWWHHIGAFHVDRRQFQTAPPLFSWHAKNQEFLFEREPIASAGIVWSQENIDFFGRDLADVRTIQPYNGFLQALINARIPYIPVHADHIERDSEKLQVLILPNVGLLSERQCQVIRQFVLHGGGLVASGETSLYDDTGNRKDDFALADLFGAQFIDHAEGNYQLNQKSWDDYKYHTYLRIGPSNYLKGNTNQISEKEINLHPIFDGFKGTDILPFGGRLQMVAPGHPSQVPMTFIPAFPIYPPEFAWMRETDSHYPALLLNEKKDSGRCAYLPASIDLLYGRFRLPDHGRLLANLVHWASKNHIPFKVDGPGLVDSHLYRKPGSHVLHLVNLNSAGVWRGPVQELIPTGPYTISIRKSLIDKPHSVTSLASGESLQIQEKKDWFSFIVKIIYDHEVFVIT
jgi:hypothetical protein